MEKITDKVNVTCRLSAEDVALLDKLAEARDRDRSYLIKQAVSEYIALQRWQIEETERALEEAKGGKFATDKEVRTMFNEFR